MGKGDFMYKKITALVSMAAAWLIFLPSQNNAAAIEENTSLVKISSANNNLFIQNRRSKNRRLNRNRRVNRNRRLNNNQTGRIRLVRRYYYRNGRRYVRTDRVIDFLQ